MEKKDFSLLNCTMSGMLAFVLSVPVHEFIHFVTDVIYNHKVIWFSANAVASVDGYDYMALPPFHRIMAAGGSASIINAIVALVVFFVIVKAKLSSKMRVFLIQFFGMQMCLGFGYFMINGITGSFGDWGNVFNYFSDSTVVVMRAILGTLGVTGIIFTMFALNYMSYYFIEDVGDKKERFRVALGLHLLPFVVSSVFAVIVDMNSILMREGYMDANPFFAVAVRFMFIPLFWAFLYTWFMVKHPKESRFKAKLPSEPQVVLWIVTIILLLVDLLILAPGIMING